MGLCYMILSYETITVIRLLSSFYPICKFFSAVSNTRHNLWYLDRGLDVLCSAQPQDERYQADVTVLSRLRPFHFANSFSFFGRVYST
jgi:hypothetical protein